MSDKTELKRLAEHHLSLGQAYTVAKPSVLLALIAENERLAGCDKAYAEVWEKSRGLQSEMDEIVAERDQLKAENAGLKTGYEAYERVNAELKAEVGALRRDKSEPCDGCFMADAEVLRKDAGRYRWLRRAGNTKAIALVAEHCLDALDEAIDAALGQGEQS